jgi:hypothetical protein
MALDPPGRLYTVGGNQLMWLTKEQHDDLIRRIEKILGQE